MEKVNIMKRPTTVTWDYDEDADVLYLSAGDPRQASGLDIGNGVVLRYDESTHEVVGLTLIGLKAQLLRELADAE